MDATLSRQPDGDNSSKIEKKRRRRKNKKRENNQDMEASDKMMDDKVPIGTSSESSLNAESVLTPVVEPLAESPVLTKDISVANAGKKKKRKRKKKAAEGVMIIGEVKSMDLAEIATESTDNLDDGVVSDTRKLDNKSVRKSIGQTRLLRDVEPADIIVDDKVVPNLSNGNVLNVDTIVQPAAEQQMPASGPLENISEGNAGRKRKKRVKKKIKKVKIEDEVKSMDQTEIALVSTDNLADANSCGTRKRKRTSRNKSNSVDEPGKSTQIECGPSSLSPNLTLIPSARRKLLVLDVNGLLADIVQPPIPQNYRPNARVHGRAIFTRPYFKDFLRFCFQNFDVGIWSSRSLMIVSEVVKILLGNLRTKLKLFWNRSHCTMTKFKTLDNKHKPIVCKELRKIWEISDPKGQWKKGDYDESNTLLLDDSPYKALLNPLHTAIFPHTYRYTDDTDNSLGPNGDLTNYLKGLLESENVQSYVKAHPFGQEAITEKHASWKFYAQVVGSKSGQRKNMG